MKMLEAHITLFWTVGLSLLLQVCFSAAAAAASSSKAAASRFSPLGMRFPLDIEYKNNHEHCKNKICETGAICVEPIHDHYPLGHSPGTLFASRFVVPDLPKEHDSSATTYYDYFNIFWRETPEHGYMNQFVPQLMLGNALAHSTNFPDYNPIWMKMDEWHIGAQYFFALTCNHTEARKHSSDAPSYFSKHEPCWIPKAATGKLIKVEPGELIETTFKLIQVSGSNDWEWHLRIGVVGAHPTRWSLVVVREPFMGFIPQKNGKSTSWQDDIYKNVTVGSCLENYGMKTSRNYPPTWEIIMDIIVNEKQWQPSMDNFYWDNWKVLGGPKCPWLPQSTLSLVEGPAWQRVKWNATIYDRKGTDSTSMSLLRPRRRQ